MRLSHRTGARRRRVDSGARRSQHPREACTSPILRRSRSLTRPMLTPSRSDAETNTPEACATSTTPALPNLIGQLLLDPFLRVRRKEIIGCLVGMLRKLTSSLVDVTKLFFVALAPAANQKVQAFLDPHHRRHRL